MIKIIPHTTFDNLYFINNTNCTIGDNMDL